VFYTAASGSNGSMSQGIQKSIELFTLSNSELTSVNLEVVIYPNPTSDYIKLKITDIALANLSYILMDIQGKVVSKAKINGIETRVSMQDLSLGTYVLKVSQKNIELKSFKIIKK
jgi:predicted metalloenzyme YecM